jgi:hypothetical protein
VILRDTITHHRKFLLAGQLIGGVGGAARALALWVAAIGYAREQLTNGFVDDEFIRKFSLDTEAEIVARALSSARVRLFHKAKGGYLVHDYVEHNGDAAKLRYQRQLAKNRKRRWRGKQEDIYKISPVENLWRNASVTRDARDTSVDTIVDSHAYTEKEKEYVRTSIDRGTIPASPVQRTDSGNSGTAATLASTAPKLNHPKTGLARQPAGDGNYAVIERLAHAVMDDTGLAEPTGELIELVKRACATRRIDYGRDPTVARDVVRRAVESACRQRLVTPVAAPRGMTSVATLAAKLRTAADAAALTAQVRSLRKPSQ